MLSISTNTGVAPVYEIDITVAMNVIDTVITSSPLPIPRASKAYITRVDAEPDGDAFFPDFAVDEWNLVSDTAFGSDQLHSASYSIEIYDR